MQKTLKPLRALELMRDYSRQNIPFSVAFISLNETQKLSEGLKREVNIVLRSGYRRNQSKKYEILVSFIRLSTGEKRQFYFPLLMEFNGIPVRP